MLNDRQWTTNEVLSLLDLLLPELMRHAMAVHREHHDPLQVELASLLSVKTGGCPEDRAYCPQAARCDTGVEASKLMEPHEVHAAALLARQAGATRFCSTTRSRPWSTSTVSSSTRARAPSTGW